MKEKILNAKKILIIGESGRGKTSLAIKLSKKLSIPHYSTDDVFWKVRFSEPYSKEERLKKINNIYSAHTWIMEGSTTHLITPGIEASDIIINLKFRSIIEQWLSLIKRHIGKKSTFENESFREFVILLGWVTRKRYGIGSDKEELKKKLLKPYHDKIIELKSFKEIDNFINQL